MGSYIPVIDYFQLALSPVLKPTGEETCLATVPIELELEGDIVGKATTSASVFVEGPCSGVAAGQGYVGLFYMKGIFRGFLAEEQELIVGELTYSGFTDADAQVQGKITIEGPFFGNLDVVAETNVGGTFAGGLERI